jgi:hypothetical protein
VLRVVRKGGWKAKVPLTPATVAALDAYLADRAQRAGAGEWRQLSGPLLATATDGRLRQGHLWEPAQCGPSAFTGLLRLRLLGADNGQHLCRLWRLLPVARRPGG